VILAARVSNVLTGKPYPSMDGGGCGLMVDGSSGVSFDDIFKDINDPGCEGLKRPQALLDIRTQVLMSAERQHNTFPRLRAHEHLSPYVQQCLWTFETLAARITGKPYPSMETESVNSSDRNIAARKLAPAM
jgi:hypothetical protein